MKYPLLVLLCVAQTLMSARVDAAQSLSDAELSLRLAASAEQLLALEKRIAAQYDDLDSILYEDVLSLLDEALSANPQNLHARALSADVLLLKSYEGDGTYDVCTLLDAKSEAQYVVSRSSRAGDADLATARAVLRKIERIPPDAIPDPPSSCNDKNERPGISATRAKAR
jgi:hypothetical protein